VIEQEDVLRWDFHPPTPDDEKVKARFAQKVEASGGASDPPQFRTADTCCN